MYDLKANHFVIILYNLQFVLCWLKYHILSKVQSWNDLFTCVKLQNSHSQQHFVVIHTSVQVDDRFWNMHVLCMCG